MSSPKVQLTQKAQGQTADTTNSRELREELLALGALVTRSGGNASGQAGIAGSGSGELLGVVRQVRRHVASQEEHCERLMGKIGQLEAWRAEHVAGQVYLKSLKSLLRIP